MKNKSFKKCSTIILIFVLLFSIFQPLAANANIAVVEDGMPISDKNKYEIREFSNLDYFLREYWDVRVDNVSKGKMALFVPPGEDSNQGRTMAHKNTLYQWGEVFNGNPQYVEEIMLGKPTMIKRLNDGNNFVRYYSVEIGRNSGAKVVARGSGSNGYLEVTTSPFPLITKLQTPVEVTQNTDFDVVFSGIEYDPFSSNMSYKVLVNGSPKATGTFTAAQLGVGGNPAANGTITNFTEKIQIAGTGTYTVELLLTDGIQRTSSRTTTVNVKAKPPTGKPSLEITPSVETVKVGEIATYKAIYHDGKGGQTDVTTQAGTSWSVAKTTIGQLQSTKGKVKGIQLGDTDVKASYSGLTATATLIVEADPPPPTPNFPPTVSISGPREVMIGEIFCLTANAFASNPDGTIEEYVWSYTGNGALTGRSSCGLSYNSEGFEQVSVTVYDDKGAEASANHTIKVVPPLPSAHFTVSGTEKENRKLELKALHPYGNRQGVLGRFPLVTEQWTITAVNPANQDKIRTVQNISGNVSYTQVVEMLMKKEGKYKVKRYVKNNLGYDDTYEIEIDILPDLPPVADFSAITMLYRDEVKETDADTSKATIKVDDFSYSRDDSIVKRIWSVTYDSNNDGNFEDETPQILSEANLDFISFKTNKVGKYKIELEVFEQFEQPTIEQFVDLSFDKNKTDLRFHNTTSKAKVEKVIEVENLAPHVSFEVEQPKKVQIEVQRGNMDITPNALESAVNSKLKTKLLENDFDVDIVYKDAILDRVHDDYGFEMLKTGVTVGKPSPYYEGTFEPKVATQLSNGNYAIVGQNWKSGSSLNTSATVAVLDQNFNPIREAQEASDLFGYNGSRQKIAETSDGKFMLVPGMWYGDQNIDLWDADLKAYSSHNMFNDTTTSHPNIKQIEPVGDDKFLIPTNKYLGIFKYENGKFTQLNRIYYPEHKIPNSYGGYDTFGYQSKYLIVGDTLLLEYYYSGTYGSDFRWVSFKIDIDGNKINLSEKFSVQSTYNSYEPVLSNSKEYMAVYHSGYSGRNFVKIYRVKDMQLIDTIYDPSDYYRIQQENIHPIRDNEFFIGILYSDYYSPVFQYKVFNAKTKTTETRTIPGGRDYLKYFGGRNLVQMSKKDLFLTYSTLTNNSIKNSNFAVMQFGFYNKINIEQKYDDHFTIVVDNSTITPDAGNMLKSKLNGIDSHLLAYSKAENKGIFESVISSNAGKGSYYDSSANLASSLEEMANYIYEEITRKTIDLQINLSDTKYSKAQIEDMVNRQLKPRLNENKIKANITYKEIRLNNNPTGDMERMYFFGSRFNASETQASWSRVDSSSSNPLICITDPTWEPFSGDCHYWQYYPIDFANTNYEYYVEHGGTTQRIYSRNFTLYGYVQPRTWNNVFIYRKLVKPLPSYSVDETVNTFSVVVRDSALSSAEQDFLVNQLNNKDVNFISLGSSSNKAHFDNVISRVNKATHFDNTNLKEAINNMADYIIAEENGIKEIYITLEDEVKYYTYYRDYEKDPHHKDRWRYDHLPTVFENNTGQDPRHMKDLDLPITQFAYVGRYQPLYSANDDPLKGIFQEAVKPLFEPYRKWAKDADNWYIYVHRKPVPEFSFTIDKTTREYSVKNEAYDLDKYSIDIGFGPGLRDQRFTWRVEGENEWKSGLPPSPLSLKVYEVKNTVTDFQNKTESKIKTLNATGLNAPPVPLFEIKNYIPQGTTATPKDFSYDPNGDTITGYQWQIKKKSEPDSAFKDIANSANKAAPELPFNTVGTYVIRLKVKDQPGLWSAPPNEWHYEEVEVYSPNSPPVAGFDITPQQYIGEAIDITSTATDLDGDTLIYEYTVKPPGSRAAIVFKTGESVTDRNGKVVSVASNGNFQIPTYDQTDVGIWTVTQKVTDPMGASATAGPKQAVVKDLTMKGYVNHTEAWQQIHLDKGNLPHEFYSGEKFILKADVISRPIRSVSVKATGRLENNSNFNASVTLNKDTDILYAGEYFEQRFTEIGSQIRTGTDVTFVFTTIYENGTLEGYAVTDIVTVTIIGSALGLLELHQAY